MNNLPTCVSWIRGSRLLAFLRAVYIDQKDMMFKLFRLSAYVNFAVAHLRENVVSGGLVEVASKHSVADAAI